MAGSRYLLQHTQTSNLTNVRTQRHLSETGCPDNMMIKGRKGERRRIRWRKRFERDVGKNKTDALQRENGGKKVFC